jgi:hypothetical protein
MLSGRTLALHPEICNVLHMHLMSAAIGLLCQPDVSRYCSTGAAPAGHLSCACEGWQSGGGSLEAGDGANVGDDLAVA